MSARWDLKAQLLGADIPQQLNDVVFEQYINPEDDFSFGNTCAARIEFATYESGPTLNNEELTFQYKDSTSTIWNNLGTFKVLECKDEYDNSRIYKHTFVGYDAMIYAFNIKYDYQVTLPATPNDVLRDIATQTGITINSLPVIYPVYVPAQPSTTPISNMPYITFIPPECTIREMIGYIAGLHGCNAVMNKNGSVSWVQYYSHHPITIDASDIYDDTPDIDATTVTSIGQIRYIANRYRSDGTTYRDEYISGTYTQGNSQLIIRNPYMAEPIVNALATIILGTSSMNVSIDTIKSFDLLDSDSYTFTANGSTYTLPKMYLRIEWDGGAMATVSSFGVTGDANTTSYTSPTESSIEKIVNVIQNSSGIAQYLQTPNTSGFNTNANGDFIHKSNNNNDTFNIYSYNNDSTFGVNYENGLITIGDDAGLTAGTSPYYHALYHETNSRYRHHLGNGNFIYSTSSTPIDANDTVDYMDEIVDFTYKGGTGKKPRYFNVINYLDYSGWSEVKPFVLDLINGHVYTRGNIIAPGQLIVTQNGVDDTVDDIVSQLDDSIMVNVTELYWLDVNDMKLRKINSYDATTRTSTWDVVFDFNQGGGGISYTFGAGLSLDTSTNTVTNSGVRSVATGTTNGTISVNTNGATIDIPVNGLGTMAYKSSLTQSDVTTGLGYTPIDSADKGQANGVAELDANGLVPSSQLPSYVDDVLEYATMSSFPATGQSGKIYVDLSTNLTYRWSGSAYVEISPSLALGTTSSTAFRGDYGQTAYNHSQQTSGNPHNVTKTDVGLGNVPNVTTDNQTPTVSEATTRTNLAVGDTLAVIISKIKKFFSDLKTVAFTGDYNDLSNKPTIPTVNNGTLTIQKNGTNIKTFTANQSTNVVADIEVPLATSDLTNDSGFIYDTDVRLTAIKNPNSYVGVARYYSGVNTPSFIRIKFPDEIITKQTLLNIQIYVNVAGMFGGNIYICAMHGANYAWQGNAYCYEYLHGNVNVFASDGKYIYIDMRRVSQNYITLTIDNLTVGGNAEEVDFSETTIDSVSSLPSAYQTLTTQSIEADYATTAGSATDSTKLPLSGGTINGYLDIDLNPGGSGGTLTAINIKLKDDSLSGFMRNQATSTTTLAIDGDFKIYNDIGGYCDLKYTNLGGSSVVKTIYLPHADGTIALVSDLASYLPLSGGSLTGRLTLPSGLSGKGLHINASSGDGLYLWGDGEGGNIRICTPTTATEPGYWEIDAQNGSLRIFKYVTSESANKFPFTLSKDNLTVTKINNRKINSSTANIFNGIPIIQGDGIMQIGNEIRFHYSDELPTVSPTAKLTVNSAGTLSTSGAISSGGSILLANGKLLYTNAGNSNYSLKFTYFTNPMLQIIPNTDNAVYLGHSSYRFAEVRAVNMYIASGTAVTSDRRKKNTINDINIELAESIVMGLKPSSFKYNDGESGRLHYGFIAQDVEELINSIGITSEDFAPLIIDKIKEEIIDKDANGNERRKLVDTGEVEYSLRYEEFIAPMVSVIQKQQEKINELESRLDVIERMLNNE